MIEKNALESGPGLEPGRRILLAGASSDIGCGLLKLLAAHGAKIGAHYYRNRDSLTRLVNDMQLDEKRIEFFSGDLSVQSSCHRLIDAFVDWAGGIDVLVQLTGDVKSPRPWEDMSEEEWLADINVNLSGPFFLAQRSMKYMRSGGGRVVLTGTASAQHGGGRTSLAYGVAKAGIECLVKGLAREGASYGGLVNGVAPGFIETKFHTERMHRGAEELKRRAELVPLKRAGRTEDVARMIVYLLSAGGDYITGQCIAVSGGDWL